MLGLLVASQLLTVKMLSESVELVVSILTEFYVEITSEKAYSSLHKKFAKTQWVRRHLVEIAKIEWKHTILSISSIDMWSDGISNIWYFHSDKSYNSYFNYITKVFVCSISESNEFQVSLNWVRFLFIHTSNVNRMLYILEMWLPYKLSKRKLLI